MRHHAGVAQIVCVQAIVEDGLAKLDLVGHLNAQVLFVSTRQKPRTSSRY